MFHLSQSKYKRAQNFRSTGSNYENRDITYDNHVKTRDLG